MSSDEKLVLWVLALCALLTLFLGIVPAHAQQSGFSISPDGQVTQWGPSGGYTSGPDGQGSWDNSGGYSVSPDGGYSTWSGSTTLPPGDPISPDPEWSVSPPQ